MTVIMTQGMAMADGDDGDDDGGDDVDADDEDTYKDAACMEGGATLIRWSSNPKLGHMHLHPTPADHQDHLEHHLDHRKPECLAGLVHCCTRMS